MSTSLDKLNHDRDIIVWFEIPATNFDRAVQFYRDALSLKIQIIILNNTKHGVIRNKYSHARGSIVERDNLPTGGDAPLLYFRPAYDISTTLESIVKAGGSVTTPKTLITDGNGDKGRKIPFTLIDNKIGYYAVFTDTEGNRVAIYNNS